MTRARRVRALWRILAGLPARPSRASAGRAADPGDRLPVRESTDRRRMGPEASRTGGRRTLAGLAAVALLSGMALAPPVSETDAGWNDAEVGTAQFAAMTMAAPSISDCTIQTLLGVQFRSATLTWTSSYDPQHVLLTVRDTNGESTVVGDEDIAVAGPSDGEYEYSAVLSSGVLENLVGNLLGGRYVLSVVEQYPESTWESPAATRSLVINGLGGLLGASCSAP